MNEFQHDTSSCEVLGLLGIFIILEAIGNPVKTIARSVGGSSKNKNTRSFEGRGLFCPLKTEKGRLIVVFDHRDFSYFGLVVCFWSFINKFLHLP